MAKCARLAGLVFICGCSLLASEELALDATLPDGSIATPDAPVAVRVTVRNIGEARASWGPGSSTCKLQLMVRVDGVDRFAPVNRVCTMDLTTHVLDPGESYIETLTWDGRVQLGSGPEGIEQLPPGTYELLGYAKDGATSERVLVTLKTGE